MIRLAHLFNSASTMKGQIGHRTSYAIMLEASSVAYAVVWVCLGTQIMMMSAVLFPLQPRCRHEGRGEEHVSDDIVPFLSPVSCATSNFIFLGEKPTFPLTRLRWMESCARL